MGLGDLNKSNRPSHRYSQHATDKLEECLNNTATIGTVTQVDKENMTVNVDCLAGEINVTAFVMAQGSDDYKQWIPPVVGDKVILLSDNGDFNNSYAFPIRLPSSFNSDIPDGMIIRAGDLTIQYNKDDNRYSITNGDRSITIDGDNIEINNNNSNIEVNSNDINVNSGDIDLTTALNSVNINSGNVRITAGPSTLILTPSSCTITVPGGVMSINGGSFSFNGQEVVRV